jgi:hypothetical protein
MGLSTFVGSFLVPNATGNKAITGVGFQPKIVFFFGTEATATGPASIASSFFWGVGISSSNRLVVNLDMDGSDVYPIAPVTTKCISQSASNTIEYVADLVSLDSDGFTVNFSAVLGNGTYVGYLCLGGADLTNVNIVSFTTPTSTGNSAFTGMGFKPDALILLGVDTYSHGHVSHGFAVSSTQRGAISNAYDGSTEGTYTRNDKCFVLNADTSVVRRQADLVTLDSDGATLNWDTVNAATQTVYAIGLKGPSFAAGTVTQRTTTGSQSTSGLSFAPKGLLLLHNGQPHSTSVAAGGGNCCVVGVGIADSALHRFSMFAGDRANQRMDVDTARVFLQVDDTTVTLDAAADLTSLDTTGFTLNYDTADATAREIHYLAFGNAPAPLGSVDRPRGDQRPFPFKPGSAPARF